MSTSDPWFTSLSLEYARQFTELEFARNRFEGERDRILEELVGRASPGTAGGQWRREAPPRRMLLLASSGWAEFQKSRGRPNMYAGCALTLGDAPSFSDTGACVFVAQAFFGGAADVARIATDLVVPDCQRTVANFGYVRFARLFATFPEGFALERFREAADDLLPFFRRTEAVLIEAVRIHL